MSRDRLVRRADAYFSLRDHPLRSALSREMHGRKLPPIEAPARLMQVIVVIADEHLDEERAKLREILPSQVLPDENTRYLKEVVGDAHLIWERHTEFSSYMLIRPGPFDRPFDQSHFDVLSRDWFLDLPGQVVRATQLAVLRDEDCVVSQEAFIAESFVAEDLVHCELMDGRVGLWSDFRLNEDGFGRLLISAKGATPGEMALAIQRVQELGNYRNLALLGLPVAQTMGRRLNALEARVSSTTQEIAEGDSPDEQLLQKLSGLSADIARIIAQTHYRMSASRAYAEMVEDRLRALRVTRIPGHPTLGDFTERRLLPAVRTCLSFSSRLEVLAQQASAASSLLRTRVHTKLTTQNHDLLRSMNRRTALQLALQKTVEGLSVVAITYYATGLLGYLVKGFEPIAGMSHDRIVAVGIPVIMLCVWLGLHQVHRRLDRAEKALDESVARPKQDSAHAKHDKL